MIVDAHHHLWDPGTRRHAWLDALPQLRRPFGVREFSQLAAAHSVTASVLVQVLASAAETEEFLALAGRLAWLAGPTWPTQASATSLGWEPAQITPYANRLLDCFGPARLMFGSDWPVSTLAAGYGDVLRLAVTALASRLSQAELDGLLAGNAARCYGLRLQD